MLIAVETMMRCWSVKPKGVLHVGAHEAEESVKYRKFLWTPVIWVEAQPEKIEYLKRKLDPFENSVIEAAVWNVSGIPLDLKITSNSESTSLLDFGTHKVQHPSISVERIIPVVTQILDDLVAAPYPELLELDIQGAELKALQGYSKGLLHTKWIYCEVNRELLYEGCSLISEIDDFLHQHGFIRAATRWTIHEWGDALYINESVFKSQSKVQKFLWFISETKYFLLLKLRELKKSVTKDRK